MIENDGNWLKLMRTALLPTDANIFLRISGSELVCTVTKDVNKEVELKVTCRIDAHNQGSLPTTTKIEKLTVSDSSEPVKEETDSETSSKECPSPKIMLDRISERVSDSEDMLSKKSSLAERESPEVKKMRIEYAGEDSDCDLNEARIERSSSTRHRSPSSDEKQVQRNHSLHINEATSRGRNKSVESDPSSNVQYTEEDKIYRCMLCNFASGEQISFDKHVKTHRNQTGKRLSSSLTNSKSFCEACKIQFMSVDTYQVHKQFYCKGRHLEKDEVYSCVPVQDSNVDIPANAIKPGPETVIIRSGVNGGLASSMIQPQAIYAAISTNPLILLPCSLVNGQRLVPHTGVVPTGAPGIVLQTGIACPAIVEKPPVAKVKEEASPSRKTSHPIMNFSSADSLDRSMSGVSLLRKRKTSEGDVLNLKKSCTDESVADTELSENDSKSAYGDSDTPLDLSLKKKFSLIPCISPPKRKNSVVSIGCPSPTFQNTSDSGSPPRSSILHSRMTMSPSSYSNESTPCYSSQVPVPVPRSSKGLTERLSPVQSMVQADSAADKGPLRPGMPPPKVLKQGNNICEECHIVFYKYDNYLAHKKHYCAYRRQQLSAIAAAAAAAAASNQEHSSDDNSEHSTQNETSVNYQIDDPGKQGMRRIEHPAEHFRSVITKSSQSVYCCDACGVKFSTSDNLNAHQTYYCIKRADSAMSKASAARGDNSNSPKNLESPFSGPEEWKCNYCDATCSSYDTIRRHLLTHSELRGFRCIVCGYKGNTLRGMRSHACEHLTEGTTSIEEFVSSNVIAENGIIPIIPPTMDQSDEDSEHSRDSRKERSYAERSNDRTILKKEVFSGENSESNELSISPRMTENSHNEFVPKLNSPVKMECSDGGSPDTHGSHHQDSPNPMAFCDVVIKTENEQSSSGEDSSHGEHSKFIKFEPEPEYDSDDKPSDISKSPPAQATSVIRRASDTDKNEAKCPPSTKRKGKFQAKQDTELKYCKSCDISFSHLSNFLAHKKYYCVSRVIQNCHQEAATVQ